MLILKTSFQINDHILNRLSRLVHAEVKYLSSFGHPVHLTDETTFYDKLFIGISNDNISDILELDALYFYYKILGDEVSTLNILFESIGRKNHLDFKLPFSEETPFKIQKIKIYGEERTRLWGELGRNKYFNQQVDFEVGDYYFNNTILRFESFDQRFINIRPFRHKLEISFQNDLLLENEFYRVDELFPIDDPINYGVCTNIQKVKCHYEIDETGIQKNINENIRKYAQK
jgi:hypothetical protein